MASFIEYLRGFSFLTVILRLCLAMAAGGIIGYGRTKRNRTAGFRTYMLVGIGAALTVLISMYESEMMHTEWADIVKQVGSKFDASRFSAQVIGGIDFLAGGSIIAVEHQQVEGLTTATGLFASAIMGIACGAGFYECVLIAFVMILFTLNFMTELEKLYKRRTRNITLYVEFDVIDNIDAIINLIKERNAHIYDIEVERTVRQGEKNPAAVFSMKLSKEHPSHSDMMAGIAELPCVFSAEELIS
ncbi:MAG: MgtC/SapB family protein [Solobacterium sp.]|nr:MgtC/SapB family protein [Solobacterium sp.]